MRVSLLALLFALTATAQNNGFSVDEQGRAWFVTSLTPREPTIEQKPRLFSLSPSGLRIEAEAQTDTVNSRALLLPMAASDGNTFCWTELVVYPTIAGRTRPAEYTGTVIRRTPFFESRVTHPGYAGLSRNGEWAVWSNPSTSALGSLWVNLATGETTTLPGVLLSTESVAADGSAVRLLIDALEVHTPTGSSDRIPTPFIPSQALISADTRRLLINSARALYLYDRDLQQWTTLAEDCDNCYIRALSPDGARVAYASNSSHREIVLLDTRTGTTSTIPSGDDRPKSLQFSDDGNTLWVMTSGLAILRIDTATGEATNSMPPTPTLTRPPEYTAPGARFRIDGDGLAAATVSLNGRPLQVTDHAQGWLQVMLPSDLPTGPTHWSLESPGALFQPPPAPVEIVPQLPQFLQLRDLGESDPTWMPRNVVFGAADGWLINPERPAIPGEVLLLWITGLNKDTAALRWTIRPFADNGLGQDLPIEAIAPDPIRPGWWIARLRLPAATPPGDTYVFCRTGDQPHQIGYALLPVANNPGNSSNESSK